MERHWNVDLRLCVFDLHCTRRENSPPFKGLYVSMDSLTLTLASFSQRYHAKAQDNINILLEQMKIVT